MFRMGVLTDADYMLPFLIEKIGNVQLELVFFEDDPSALVLRDYCVRSGVPYTLIISEYQPKDRIMYTCADTVFFHKDAEEDDGPINIKNVFQHYPFLCDQVSILSLDIDGSLHKPYYQQYRNHAKPSVQVVP